MQEITKQESFALAVANMCIKEYDWTSFDGVKLTKLLWLAFNHGRRYERENFQVSPK